MPCVGLWSLSLELREEIYQYHLLDYLRCPQDDRTRLSILTVNKLFSTELLRVFPKIDRLTYRISSSCGGLDVLFQACKRHFGLGTAYWNVRHLTVDIYAPRLNEPLDMIKIFRYLNQVHARLWRIPRLPTLTIRFLEDDVSKWAVNGRPGCVFPRHRAMPVHDVANPDQVPNVAICLAVLTQLNSVGEAKIDMPESYRGLQIWGLDRFKG